MSQSFSPQMLRARRDTLSKGSMASLGNLAYGFLVSDLFRTRENEDIIPAKVCRYAATRKAITHDHLSSSVRL